MHSETRPDRAYEAYEKRAACRGTLRRGKAAALASAAVLLGGLGCGGVAPSPAPEAPAGSVPDASPAPESTAPPPATLPEWTGISLLTCGGNDAAEDMVRVSPSPSSGLACALERPAGVIFDELNPWRPFAIGTSQLVIPSEASATACDASGCVDAVSATLTVTHLDATSASGSYTLILPDGSVHQAAFTVARCSKARLQCG